MNLGQLRREAVLAAEYVLAEIDVPIGDRIPVFDLIEDKGIWLSFEGDLDRLLGIYQQIGDVSGIAVNVARPMSLQRFTAAHELGHHELGHESHVDDDATILDPSDDPQEIQAQTFAASLLMSELAIETRLEHRGHDPDRPSLTEIDVYLLSVELGVSYKAAVTQLRALNKISYAEGTRLRKASPLALKEALLGGRRPDNLRAAVWQLTLEDNHRRIELDPADELDIALPEIRSTGYEWLLPQDLGANFLLVNDRYVTPPPQGDDLVFGGSGTRHITLKALGSGRTRLDFALSQPWEGGDQGSVFTIDAITRPAPISEVGQGISVNQQTQLLAA